jgi:hypothetical protein
MGGGGKSGSAGSTANAASEKLANLSEQLFNEGSTVRGQIQDMGSKIMSGEYSPRTLPAYAPLYAESKKGLEAQYGNARNSILSNTPAGGALYSALANNENQRASSIGSAADTLTSGLVSDILNKSIGGAYGSVGSATSGLSSAGQISSNLNASDNALTGSMGQGLGSLLGYGLGSGSLGSLGTKASTTAGGSAAPIASAIGASMPSAIASTAEFAPLLALL